MHGLRHAYAQNRYEELTGWKAPAAGGPDSKSLTPEQRELDREARLTISRELGHEREAGDSSLSWSVTLQSFSSCPSNKYARLTHTLSISKISSMLGIYLM